MAGLDSAIGRLAGKMNLPAIHAGAAAELVALAGLAAGGA